MHGDDRPGPSGHLGSRPRQERVGLHESLSSRQVPGKNESRQGGDRRLADRARQVSSIPPHQTGIAAALQMSCAATAWSRPPRRAGFTQTMSQARSAIASRSTPERANRLVQADRSLDGSCKAGVADEVVGVEWLLDAEKAETRRGSRAPSDASGSSSR